MANCAGIFEGADVSCTDPLFVGLLPRVFLANLTDVESITYSVTPGEENVITDITMKTTKAFFEFGGVAQSIKAQNELVRGDISVSYKHTVDLSIFKVGNTSLQNMQGMAYQHQIAIVFQPDDSSLENGAFTVYGKNVGMQLITNLRQLSENSTGGAHVLNLSTPDNGGTENEIPNVFYDGTSYASTLTKIELLLTPAA